MTTKTANWPSTPSTPVAPSTEAPQAPSTKEQALAPLDSRFAMDDLIADAHARAIRKGWWELTIMEGGDGSALLAPFNLPERIALIHSEASEALESYRRDEPLVWFRVKEDGTQKPEGLAIELADVVIRVADLCGAMNIDLDKAILLKSAYNETRSFRHDNKRC